MILSFMTDEELWDFGFKMSRITVRGSRAQLTVAQEIRRRGWRIDQPPFAQSKPMKITVELYPKGTT